MTIDPQRESIPLVKASIAAGHPVRLCVAAFSMRPFLCPQDIAVCIAPHRLRAGDCVAYTDTQGIVTHRILRVTSRGVLVKGDANRRADEPVVFERIIGMVVAVERGGKTIWRRGPHTAWSARIAARLSALQATIWRLWYAGLPCEAGLPRALTPLEKTARNIVLFERASVVALAARERRIEMIALKGIRYLCGISRYDEREIGDIDLLVRPADVSAMRSVLASLGYACASPLRVPLRGRHTYLNAEVWRANDTVPHFIHLHWDLINSTLPLRKPVFSLDALFSRSVPCDGLPCRALSPVDECVYAAFHAFLHGYDRAQVADDVRRVFAYHRVDRATLRAIAADVAAASPLEYAFGVIDGIHPCLGKHNAFVRDLARMQGGIGARAMFYLGAVFVPPSVIGALFPHAPLPLAYFSRLLRAVFRHGIC